MTIYIWKKMAEKLKSYNSENNSKCDLHEIKIYETEKNIAIYRGEWNLISSLLNFYSEFISKKNEFEE